MAKTLGVGVGIHGTQFNIMPKSKVLRSFLVRGPGTIWWDLLANPGPEDQDSSSILGA